MMTATPRHHRHARRIATAALCATVTFIAASSTIASGDGHDGHDALEVGNGPIDTKAPVTEPAVTEPAVTEPAVTDPAVTDPASHDAAHGDATSLTVHWDAVPGATKYSYRWKTDGMTWSDPVQTVETSAVIGGLMPGASYVMGVKGYVDGRWTATWTEIAAETGAAAGGAAHDGAGWLKVRDEHAVYRDSRTPTTYSIFDPFGNPRPGWGESRIGFFVECESVGFDQIDPIVSPGARSHHLHEFFGNPNVTMDTTTQELVETRQAEITCSDLNDKSAYWSPAVYQDGRRVTADSFKAYYKSTTTDVVPMPLGLRMVAGDMRATRNQSTQIGGWVGADDFNNLNTFGANQMMERPRPGVAIALRINFPNCWDGVHLDSPDHKSHMAYFNEDSKKCPRTHPVKLPQVTTFTQYDVDGGSGLTLSSGEWYSFHQDFWNAWSPDQFSALTDECIEARMMCRVRTTPALVKLGQYKVTIPPRR